MKAKKFTKKLVLKKLTIANLENSDEIKGGRVITKGLTRIPNLCVRTAITREVSDDPCC